MAPFPTRIYSDEQRDAISSATLDRKLTPLKHVVDLASRGELLNPAGERVRAFSIPVNTARSLVAAERRRRSGRLASALAAAPATSQAEIVRARLMAIADHELMAVERQLKRNQKPDMTRASRAAKVAREALALRAGTVLSGRPNFSEHNGQPPPASTPALQRLAAERIGASPTTAHDDLPITQADKDADEPTQAQAENSENTDERERINATMRAGTSRFAPLIPASAEASEDERVPGTHADDAGSALVALSVAAE